MKNKNLNFLKNWNPDLFKIINTIPLKQFTMTPAKKAGQTLIYHSSKEDYYLHSKFAPFQEAQRTVETIDFKANHIVILGLGLGYHLDIILQKKLPETRVMVIEPNFEIFSHSLNILDWEKIFQREDFFYFFGNNFNLLPETISKFINLISFKKMEYFEFPSLNRFFGPCHEQAKSVIDNEMKTILYDFKTRLAEKNTVGANILNNLKYIYKTKPSHLLKDKFTNKPGFIVSAGPSLDKNILHLKKIQNRGVILAVDTALKPLLKKQITPHFVFVADPSHKNYTHLNGVKGVFKNWLVVDAGVSSEVFKDFQPQIFSTSVQRPLMKIIQENAGAIGNIDAWGSVISLALNFAIYSGLNPIIFTGLDFAFSNNRNHCRNSAWEEQWVNNNPKLENLQRMEKESIRGIAKSIQIKDIYGQDTTTSERFLLYKNFFIKELRKFETSIDFINATEGGIVNEIKTQNLSDVLKTNVFNEEKIDFNKICNHTFKFTKQTNKKLSDFLKSKKDYFKKYKNKIKKLANEINESDPADSTKQFELAEASEKTLGSLYTNMDNGNIVEQWSQAPIYHFLKSKTALLETTTSDQNHQNISKLYMKYFYDLIPILEELEKKFQLSYSSL